MIGRYRTLDDCIYEVFWHQPDKRVKEELRVRCIHSTVRDGEQKTFKPLGGQIERNVKSQSWIKIEE